MNDVEIRETLARMDERIVALKRELARSLVERDKAIQIASSELARRLDVLNHAHQQSVDKEAKFMSREMSERDHEVLNSRIRTLELDQRELLGKMWLPMIIVAALAAALAAAAVAAIWKL